ncbi:MAG TPA: DUF222 domain-containing protein, partial [Acidimicrobiales bacterium]
MFEPVMGRLEEGPGELAVPVDGDALVRVARLRDRLEAVLATAVDDFDRAGVWELEGATSITAWLRDRGGMARPQAARLLAAGRRFRELPVLAAAAKDGTLSGGQVQAVVSTPDGATVPVFAAQQAELVPTLAVLGPA